MKRVGSYVGYLDISPRQTGKTERLIRFAELYLGTRKKVCFNTLAGMKAEIQARLPGALVLADGEIFPESEDPDEYYWFYDEFDWLESATYRSSSFYATTPRFMREMGKHTPDNDLLLRLVQLAGKFERHYWPFDMGTTLLEARQFHTPEEFRLFYLGEFLS
ncbi:hypothetical protein DZC31_26450 [Stenotrophomonas rhizophila]|nr:hypothetical protein DZC31_26450 [Stenotrophomonas rhizophila]